MYALTGQRYLNILNDDFLVNEISKRVLEKTNKETDNIKKEPKEYANFFDYDDANDTTDTNDTKELFKEEWSNMLNDSIDSDEEQEENYELDTLVTRITVTNEVLYKELEQVIKSTKVIVGCHDVFIHFRKVSEERIKKEVIMLCYFSQRVEFETEFIVSFSALKRYIVLNYGLNIFKSLVINDDPEKSLEKLKTIIVKNKTEVVQKDKLGKVHEKLCQLTPADIEVYNEETGPLRIPTEEDYLDFLKNLQHRPFKYNTIPVDSSMNQIMHTL